MTTSSINSNCENGNKGALAPLLTNSDSTVEIKHYKAFSMQSDTSYHLSVESALNRFKIASMRVI